MEHLNNRLGQDLYEGEGKGGFVSEKSCGVKPINGAVFAYEFLLKPVAKSICLASYSCLQRLIPHFNPNSPRD